MRAVVVYESMFGNTRAIAEAIGTGLRTVGDATVVPVIHASLEVLERADLVVVGGPTHAHGMSRVRTRDMAVQMAGKPTSDVTLDPDHGGPGVREWLDSLHNAAAKAAAFDTRLQGPCLFMGRASKGIARKLHKRGFELVAEPESFFVKGDNRLLAGEEARARRWGEELAAKLAALGAISIA